MTEDPHYYHPVPGMNVIIVIYAGNYRHCEYGNECWASCGKPSSTLIKVHTAHQGTRTSGEVIMTVNHFWPGKVLVFRRILRRRSDTPPFINLSCKVRKCQYLFCWVFLISLGFVQCKSAAQRKQPTSRLATHTMVTYFTIHYSGRNKHKMTCKLPSANEIHIVLL